LYIRIESDPDFGLRPRFSIKIAIHFFLSLLEGFPSPTRSLALHRTSSCSVVDSAPVRSGKKHSGFEQLRIRNEFKVKLL
jgi:hypothetical protein